MNVTFEQVNEEGEWCDGCDECDGMIWIRCDECDVMRYHAMDAMDACIVMR